jgi:hypothetical protein
MIATGEVTARERAIAAGLACVGWSAIGLQYWLILHAVEAERLSAGEITIRFLSYFTIQSNILVAFVLSGFAVRPRFDEWTVHPFVRSAVAAYISVVALIYFFVLRSLWAPQGAQWLADILLHYVMPVAYIAFWLFIVRKAGLRWYDPLLWLIYPALYLAFVLTRGHLSGFYPYPFIDAGKLTPSQLVWNATGVVSLFLVIGLIILLLARLMARREPV